jgi:hypothetical protein
MAISEVAPDRQLAALGWSAQHSATLASANFAVFYSKDFRGKS